MALPQNFVTIISFTLIAGVLAISAALLPTGTTERSKDLPIIEYQPPVPATAFRERDDYDLLLLNLKPVKLKVAEEISAESDLAKKIKRPLLTAISEKFESLFAAAGLQPIGPAIKTEEGGALTVYDNVEEELEVINQSFAKIGLGLGGANFDPKEFKATSEAEQLKILEDLFMEQLPPNPDLSREDLRSGIEKFYTGSTTERITILQDLFSLFGVELSQTEAERIIAEHHILLQNG
ncbi:MAG: hypothetical protein ABIH35_04565 [Patescibacteria group bacterium]